MKDLKDYLHLYLGCEVLVTDWDGKSFRDKIESVIDDKAGKRFSIYEFGDMPFEDHSEYYQFIHLILRPLSDIKENDVKILDKEVWGIEDDWYGNIEFKEVLLPPWPTDTRPAFPVYVKIINQLRKMGFDCDELIESGLALSKSTN